MTVLVIVIAIALVFGVTNGFHDSSNTIATLVATRAATPAAAVSMAAACHVVGPFLLGTAVADTVAGIVDHGATDVVALVGAATSAAVVWNLLTWWRGLPSSSSHALVGGLTGAALAQAGPSAVNWGGMDGIRPDGVLGVLFILAVSPLVGAATGYLAIRAARRATRRATRRVSTPVRRAQWFTSAGLALSHGGNDTQKTMALITLVLLAQGRIDRFQVPVWATLAAATSMTIGTALGGWRIVHTIGSGITRLRSLDGLASQAASASTIFGSAMIGAPVSTTHVVASSVVGVGLGRSWHRLRWRVVREMAMAWVLTLPTCALLGAVFALVWRRFA